MKALLIASSLACVLCMSGCANTPQKPQQITKSMTIVPPKPTVNPEADQREIAMYIILLRGWGNQMAIQLESIGRLIQE